MDNDKDYNYAGEVDRNNDYDGLILILRMVLMMLMTQWMLMLKIESLTCRCQGWCPKQTAGLKLRPKDISYCRKVDIVEWKYVCSEVGGEEEYLWRGRQPRGRGWGGQTASSSRFSIYRPREDPSNSVASVCQGEKEVKDCRDTKRLGSLLCLK